MSDSKIPLSMQNINCLVYRPTALFTPKTATRQNFRVVVSVNWALQVHSILGEVGKGPF